EGCSPRIAKRESWFRAQHLESGLTLLGKHRRQGSGEQGGSASFEERTAIGKSGHTNHRVSGSARRDSGKAPNPTGRPHGSIAAPRRFVASASKGAPGFRRGLNTW